MAVKEVRIDDIDESTDDVQRVTFSYAGANYEIDLGEKNRAEFDSAMERWIEHARVRRLAPTIRGGQQVTNGANLPEYDPKEVRYWAEQKGMDIAEKGRIPESVLLDFSIENKGGTIKNSDMRAAFLAQSQGRQIMSRKDAYASDSKFCNGPEVRFWARHKGMEVKDRGALSADLVSAFLEENPAGSIMDVELKQEFLDSERERKRRN